MSHDHLRHRARQLTPTARQIDTLYALRNLIRQHGYPPTVRELAAALGIAPTTVVEHLNALEEKGYIHRSKFAARGIRVLAEPES